MCLCMNKKIIHSRNIHLLGVAFISGKKCVAVTFSEGNLCGKHTLL